MEATKVIVKDMPENCFDCVYSMYVGEGMHRCLITNKTMAAPPEATERPEWCPLESEE